MNPITKLMKKMLNKCPSDPTAGFYYLRGVIETIDETETEVIIPPKLPSEPIRIYQEAKEKREEKPRTISLPKSNIDFLSNKEIKTNIIQRSMIDESICANEVIEFMGLPLSSAVRQRFYKICRELVGEGILIFKKSEKKRHYYQHKDYGKRIMLNG